VIKDSRMRVLEHGKVVAEIPTNRSPMMRRSIKRPVGEWKPKFPRESRRISRSRKRIALHSRVQKAFGVAEHLFQAAGCTSSTTPWCRPTPRRRLAICRRDPLKGPSAGWPWRSTAQPLGVSRAKLGAMHSVGSGAQSCVRGERRRRGDQLSELRQSREAEIMAQFSA